MVEELRQLVELVEARPGVTAVELRDALRRFAADVLASAEREIMVADAVA